MFGAIYFGQYWPTSTPPWTFGQTVHLEAVSIVAAAAHSAGIADASAESAALSSPSVDDVEVEG